MRLGDRGRIAEGCAADLLIVDGNPMRAIDAVALRRHHRLVVKNGAPVQARDPARAPSELAVAAS